MKRCFRSVLAPMAGLALGASVLAGCSTGSTEATDAPDPETESQVDADAFPVTIEHAFGETTIEEEPTRVATLGWTDQDIALSLGVVAGRRHQADLGRQRGRVVGLVRRRGRGARRRGAGAVRRRRRRAGRGDRQARARPDPGHQLGHHRGGVQEAQQDRAGRRLPRGPVDHAVADLARHGRPGARSQHPRRRGRGRDPGRDRRRQGGVPPDPGQVPDLRLPHAPPTSRRSASTRRRTRGSR